MAELLFDFVEQAADNVLNIIPLDGISAAVAGEKQLKYQDKAMLYLVPAGEIFILTEVYRALVAVTVYDSFY
jgi:hypothetical protein